MKSIFKAMVMAALCLGIVTLASCSGDSGDKNIGLESSTTTINAAPSAPANVTIGNGTQPFAVKSIDEKVATVKVDKSVMTVTGIKEGKASITVTNKNKYFGIISVNVITPLTFDKTSLNIAIGREDVVNIKIGQAPYTVNVKDSKITTATVKDVKITIKGVKAGTTTVNMLDRSKLAGTITITVKQRTYYRIRVY